MSHFFVATSPLRTKKDIVNSIKMFDSNTDLIITVSKAKNNPNLNMLKKNNNKITLLDNASKFRANRQNYNNIYNISTVSYVAKPKFIKNSLNCKKINKNLMEN